MPPATAFHGECTAQIAVGLNECGPQRDGSLEMLDCRIEAAQLEQSHAQAIVRRGIFGRNREDLFPTPRQRLELALLQARFVRRPPTCKTQPQAYRFSAIRLEGHSETRECSRPGSPRGVVYQNRRAIVALFVDVRQIHLGVGRAALG